jgi:hypothetical protein
MARESRVKFRVRSGYDEHAAPVRRRTIPTRFVPRFVPDQEVLGGVPRNLCAVIYCGGFARQESLPEVDPLNFAPLVKVPVLMLNGRYD